MSRQWDWWEKWNGVERGLDRNAGSFISVNTINQNHGLGTNRHFFSPNGRRGRERKNKTTSEEQETVL